MEFMNASPHAMPAKVTWQREKDGNTKGGGHIYTVFHGDELQLPQSWGERAQLLWQVGGLVGALLFDMLGFESALMCAWLAWLALDSYFWLPFTGLAFWLHCLSHLGAWESQSKKIVLTWSIQDHVKRLKKAAAPNSGWASVPSIRLPRVDYGSYGL